MSEETIPTVMPKIDQRIAQLGIDFVELSLKAGTGHLDSSVAFFQQQAKQSEGAERELYYNLAEYLTNQY
jgi:hypothetical protein